VDETPAEPRRLQDPRRVYCPGCHADISRVCSWFVVAIAGTVQRVNVHPHVCLECNSPINPQLPAVIRAVRPQ
jgi:hypothetical protein